MKSWLTAVIATRDVIFAAPRNRLLPISRLILTGSLAALIVGFWAPLLLAQHAPVAPVASTTPSSSETFDWKLLYQPIAFLIVGAVTQFVIVRNFRKAANKENNLDEIKKIDVQLNEFYGKITLILGRDHLFAQHLRQERPKDYRLLISLFEDGWLEALPPSGKALVEQVCKAAKELDDLITTHVGDLDPSIVEYFIRASAHFRVLSLAYEGKLGNHAEPWKTFVYPRAFDAVVHLKIDQLRARRAQLLGNLTERMSPMDALSIPMGPQFDLKWTPDSDGRYTRLLFGIDEWKTRQDRADSYICDAFESSCKFLEDQIKVKPPARVLDIGARATSWFLERGYTDTVEIKNWDCLDKLTRANPFDLVLGLGGWTPIAGVKREEALCQLYSLMSPEGVLLIVARVESDESPNSASSFIDPAEKAGFQLSGKSEVPDLFRRPNEYWTLLNFRKK